MYFRSDVLLLADVFENFPKMCLEIYKLDPIKFISVPGLVWQAALKKKQVELDLLTDVDMLLMIEKVIRGGICNAIHRYAKASNKYISDYKDENKESSFVINGTLITCMVGQKLSTFRFEWVEDISKLTKDFIKNYDGKMK